MFMRTTAVFALLAFGAVMPARSQSVRAEVSFNLGPLDPNAAGDHNAKVQQYISAIQSDLNQLVVIKKFEVATDRGATNVFMEGYWRDVTTSREAAEKLREALTGLDGAKFGVRVAVARVKLTIDDHSNREERATVNAPPPTATESAAPGVIPKESKDTENHDRIRSSPRLVLQMGPDQKTIAELTAEDVPLLRVLDDMGKTLQISFVLQHRFESVPVFLSIRGVTLDDALDAIAESVRLKLERRGHFLTFVDPSK